MSLSLHVPDLWDCIIYSNVNPFLPITKEYTECQAFFPVVRIGCVAPPPPLDPRGVGGPKSGEGYSMYAMIPPVEEVCCSSSEWCCCYIVVIFGRRDCSFIRILQTRPEGGRGERKGVSPLCLSVFVDGHLVSGPNGYLGGWCPLCMYYFSMRPQKTLNKTTL